MISIREIRVSPAKSVLHLRNPCFITEIRAPSAKSVIQERAQKSPCPISPKVSFISLTAGSKNGILEKGNRTRNNKQKQCLNRKCILILLNFYKQKPRRELPAGVRYFSGKFPYSALTFPLLLAITSSAILLGAGA